MKERLTDHRYSFDEIMSDYFSTAPRFSKPDKIEAIQEKLVQFCEGVSTNDQETKKAGDCSA